MLHVEFQMLLIDSACLPSKFFLLHLLDFFHLPEVPDETEIFERTLDDGYRGESETEPPSSEHPPKNSEQMEEVEVLTKSMHKAEVKEEEAKEHDEEKVEEEKNDGEDHPSCEDSIHQKEEEGDAGVHTDKAERDIPKSTKKGKKKKKDKTKKENDEDRDRSLRRSYSRGYSRDSYSRGRYSRRYDSRSSLNAKTKQIRLVRVVHGLHEV